MTYSILLLTSPDKLKLADIRFPTTGEEKQHSDFGTIRRLGNARGGLRKSARTEQGPTEAVTLKKPRNNKDGRCQCYHRRGQRHPV